MSALLKSKLSAALAGEEYTLQALCTSLPTVRNLQQVQIKVEGEIEDGDNVLGTNHQDDYSTDNRYKA